MHVVTEKTMFAVPVPILAAMGVPSEAEGQLPLSYGPLLDPYFELGITADPSEGDAWRLCGSPEGPNVFASQTEAMAAWRDLFGTQIWLRDTLARSPLRMEHGAWTIADQISHYLLIEQVVDDLYHIHQDYSIVASTIADWFDAEAGHRGWFATPVLPIRKEVADNIGPLVMDPASLADRMACLNCRWVTRHHMAFRTSRASVHETGSTYAPAMIVHTKQDRAWLNPAIMATVWGRATAYALGMPRIPASVIISHRTRPGMLRMLTGWVLRAGWRSTPMKIPVLDLPSWYGHGPGQSITTLRRRIPDDIGRIRLAFQDPIPAPTFTSTGLVLQGLQGVTLEARRRPDEL